MNTEVNEQILLQLASDYQIQNCLQTAGNQSLDNLQNMLTAKYPQLELLELVTNTASGLDAMVVKIQNAEGVILVFEGSTDTQDWKTNLANGANKVPAQYLAALELADRYKGKIEGITGNSLGGSLAQFVGAGHGDEITIRTLNAATINTEMLLYLEEQSRLNNLPNVINYYTDTDVLAPIMGIRDGSIFAEEGVFPYLVNVGENKWLESSGSYSFSDAVKGHIGDKLQTKYGAFHPVTQAYIDSKQLYDKDQNMYIYQEYAQVLISSEDIALVTERTLGTLTAHSDEIIAHHRLLTTMLAESGGAYTTRSQHMIDYIDELVLTLPGGFGFGVRMLYSESRILQGFTHYLAAEPFIGKILRPLFQKLQPVSRLRLRIGQVIEDFTSACASDLGIQSYTNEAELFVQGPIEQLLTKYLAHTVRSIEFGTQALSTYTNQFRKVGALFSMLDNAASTNRLALPTTIPLEGIVDLKQTEIRAKCKEIEQFTATIAPEHMQHGLLSTKLAVVTNNLPIVSTFIMEVISYLQEEILRPLLQVLYQQQSYAEHAAILSYTDWEQKYISYQYTSSSAHQASYEKYIGQKEDALHKTKLFIEEVTQVIGILSHVDQTVITGLLVGLQHQLVHELIRDTVLADILKGMQQLQSSFEIVTKMVGVVNAAVWENKGKSITTLQNIGKQTESLFTAILSEIMLFRL